jgi:hypothetical protein
MSNPIPLIKDWGELCRYYFPTSILAAAPNFHQPTAYAITKMRLDARQPRPR